jgi:squalene-associated FAD-dependent desaturase
MSNVIVIGGGFSGVAAACRLAGDGHSVTLFERSPRLGGRAASFVDPESGLPMDFGHHILMRCCTAAQGFLQRVGRADAVRFQESLAIPILWDGRRSALRAWPLPSPLHLVPGLLGYGPLSVGERLSTLAGGLALLAGRARGGSFGAWLSEHHQSDRAIRRFWDPISIAALNVPVDRAGLAAARHLFRTAFFVRGGADIGFFTHPLGSVFDAARTYIEARGGVVETGTAIARIGVDPAGGLTVERSDARRFEASAVVVAVPPADLARLVGGLSAMGRILEQAGTLSWAPIVNLHLWFDRPVLSDDFAIAVDSPVQALFGLSEGESPARRASHLVLSQSAAESWIDRTDEEIVRELSASLERILPAVRQARIIRSLVLRHRRATFVPAPDSESLRASSATPVSGLALAGDWTATGWPSTIEGAVRSGIYAAARVEALGAE